LQYIKQLTDIIISKPLVRICVTMQTLNIIQNRHLWQIIVKPWTNAGRP